ncbi:hypothetical protein P280DRAFT_484655 [Massarina eburnea CBS 473.64]|uniref:DUF676 domain-containing protein n=1 Tax=Massarina eburnea CBS 473.64 TaxID=1395130 RepID=A0A6A6RJC2_9PLEO|nr:hypothetical protein P280DRAFT_484655 [Massarina eburnea CBS 473.64]
MKARVIGKENVTTQQGADREGLWSSHVDHTGISFGGHSSYKPANKNNLFAHAKDLLYALERERPMQRPIIFVAHSLGGIMVKETLRRSEISREPSIRDTIQSTVGVVFLGTPHRGSPGLANLGEIVRRTASHLLRVDSNATVLRTLGYDSPELELCRESFATQWREFNFRVKTFQEAYGIGGVAIGPMGEKFVPDSSSSLDDAREHAESINANHMDMVRFDSAANPGYQKVAGELRIIINQLPEILYQKGCHFGFLYSVFLND